MSAIRRALAVYANPVESHLITRLIHRYTRLRDMTTRTTIDVANQARDYCSEFYRMRRCILPSVQIPFIYPLTKDNSCKEVLLVGDFTNWMENPMKMERRETMFYLSLPLKEGYYHYK